MGKTLINSLLFVIVFVTLSLWQQFDHIHKFPVYHHSWTQSDRYAIALKFKNETLNIFKPESFNLRPSYYEGDGEQLMTGVSAMDLPLIEYLVGITMRITGNDSPDVFRWWALCISLLGLFFIFRIPILFGHNVVQGLALAGIFYSSVIYHHYMVGFLPSMMAFSIFGIGTYFLARFWKENTHRSFIWAVLLFTVAALLRLPFAINLLALLISIALGQRFLKGETRKLLRPLIIAICIVGLYWLYNQYLRTIYGSMFISNFQLPETWAHAKHLVKVSLESWGIQYLHWVGYAFIIVMALWALFRNGRSLLKGENRAVLFHFLAILAGAACFSVLLLQQFPNHDYYGLDAFLPPVVIGLVLCYWVIKPNVLTMWFIPGLGILGMALFSLPYLNKQQELRYFVQAWNLNHKTYRNFKGSDAFLDEKAIPADAKMLVIDAYTTNIPLIEMKRDGFTLLTTSKSRMEEALKWPFDYVVLQDTFEIPEVVMNYPGIVDQLTKVCSNGKINVYRLGKPKNRDEAICKVYYHSKQSFDQEVPDSCWTVGQATQTDLVKSGSVAALMKPDDAFSKALKLYPGQLGMDSSKSTLVLTGYFNMDSVSNEVSAVVSITRGDSLVHYGRQYFVYRIHGIENKLERAVFHFELPPIGNPDDELKCYFWKEGNQHFYFDDLEVLLHQ